MFKVVGLFLQFVIGITLARAMGASGYGIYAFPMAVVTLLSVPAMAGMPQILIRNISGYLTMGSYGLIRGLLIRANQFVILISLTIAGAATVIYFFGGHNDFFSVKGTTFLLSMLLLPIVALNNVRMAALQGLRKVVLGQFPETIVKPLVFIGIIFILFIFFEKKLSPSLAMSFQVTAAFCAFIFGSFLLIGNQPKEMKATPSEYETRKWLKIVFPFMFLGMIQVINKQTDMVMLGLMRSSAEVGIYQAVVHGSNLISFVLVAVNTAQAPQIARLWSSDEKQQLQQMLTATARIVALSTVIASVTLILGGRFFLFLLFGQEFTEGFKALQILCMGQIVNGLAGSVGSILHMTGYEIKALQAMGLSAVINIVLNLYLVPRYGMEGAALATAISLSVWNILMVIWVKKYTGLNSTALGKIQK